MIINFLTSMLKGVALAQLNTNLVLIGILEQILYIILVEQAYDQEIS